MMTLDLNNLTTETTFQELVDAGYDKTNLCDAATWELIVEEFSSRRVQPDFDRFFSKKLKRHFPAYLELLRIEPGYAEYDWFVQNYKEQQATSEGQINHSSTSEKTNSNSAIHGGTVGVSGTNGNTRTLNTTDTLDSSTVNGHTSSENRTSGDVSRTTEVQRQNPMSAEFSASSTRSATAGGVTESQVWSNILNPSVSGDNLQHSGHNEGVTGSGQDTETVDNTSHQTGTVTDAGSNSSTTTRQLTDTEQGSSTDETQFTRDEASVRRTVLKGRSTDIAELLRKAENVIIDSNAFDYLKSELNKCFMMCL